MSANIKTGGTGTIKTLSSGGNAQVYTMNPEFERAVGFISDASFSISVPSNQYIQCWDNTDNRWSNFVGSNVIRAGEYPFGYAIFFRGGNTNPDIKSSVLGNWKISVSGSSSNRVICRGNIKYLLSYDIDNWPSKKRIFPENYFLGWLKDNPFLISAPQFPKGGEVKLNRFCYKEMFRNCTSLIVAPELPATILAEYCYNSMFKGCSNIQIVPKLPATYLPGGCYTQMFANCKNLRSLPDLSKVTKCDTAAVQYMFYFDNDQQISFASKKKEGKYTTPYQVFSSNVEAENNSITSFLFGYVGDPVSPVNGGTVYIDASIAIV